jgi:hypothetical protein
MRGRVHLAGALVLALLFVSAGLATDRPAAAEPEERVPVILFIFDELPTVSLLKRPGVIDQHRFPNFSRLSREATWYPNHTTSAEVTIRSIPTLLTGKRATAGVPGTPGKPATVENYPKNLFALLRSNGYSQEIREFSSEFCPQEFCPLPEGEIGAEQGFTDPIDFMKFKIPTRYQLVSQLLPRWLKSRSFGTDFLFAHSFLPHEPYFTLPDGRRYRSGAMPRMAEGSLGPITDSQAAAGQAWQRQIIQIARVDKLLGILRSRAKAAGVWDRALVVITTDHGTSFRSGVNRRSIVKENAASIAYAPLFVKYPGQTSGGPVETRTQEVDVLPTIAEVTGVEAYPDLDGMPISQVNDPWRPANIDDVEWGRGLLERRLEADLKLKRRMLGTRDIWQMGPKAGLIGRKIPPSKLAGPRRPSLRVDNRKEFTGLKQKSDWVPALIYGRSTRLKPGAVLAVGVNGRIAGTARLFDDGKLNRFGTVVDPRLFRRNNQVTVNLVRDGKLGRRVS